MRKAILFLVTLFATLFPLSVMGQVRDSQPPIERIENNLSDSLREHAMQDSSPYARRFRGATLPANCTPYQTQVDSATGKLNICTANNIWSAISYGSGGGLSGLTSGQYLKATGATTVSTDGVKRYVALLSQSGTAAPTVVELENSLGGTPTFARTGTGVYTLSLTGAFPDATKVWMNPKSVVFDNFGGTTPSVTLTRMSADVIRITTNGDPIYANCRRQHIVIISD